VLSALPTTVSALVVYLPPPLPSVSFPQGIVKQFFNEEEVTGALVMDALYNGCKQVEDYSQLWSEPWGLGGEA